MRATSIGPTSQRHKWACDNELADFARLRDAAILVDYRKAVARERIADWNSGIFVWKARTILSALEHHEPVTVSYTHLTLPTNREV